MNPQRVRRQLQRFLAPIMQGRLVRNTAWAGASELTRALAGMLSFILLARALGPGAFGRYAGSLALIWAVMPFATLGRPHLIIQQVSRHPESFRQRWSDALVAVVFGGLAATGLVMALRPLLLPSVPARVLLLLALCEFVGSGIGEAAAGAAQAVERLPVCAVVRMFFAAIRLVAAAAFFVAGGDRLADFPPFQLVACAVGAAVAVALVSSRCGRLGRPARPTLRSLAAGLPFSFSTASFMTQDGIDKTVLVRSGFVAQAGAYAAAYKFVSVTLLPVTAVLVATYARFFQAGKDGLAGAWAFGRRLLVPLAAYGAVVAAGAIVAAPLLSVVLGDGYDHAVPMIRALAFLPLVRILQYFPANALTGSGHHKLRTACQAATAVLTIGLCFALIPAFGWVGAVFATLIAEVLFAVAVWSVLVGLLRRERRAGLMAVPGPDVLRPAA